MNQNIHGKKFFFYKLTIHKCKIMTKKEYISESVTVFQLFHLDGFLLSSSSLSNLAILVLAEQLVSVFIQLTMFSINQIKKLSNTSLSAVKAARTLLFSHIQEAEVDHHSQSSSVRPSSCLYLAS